MIRSSLTALIYNKTLSRNYDDVDAGHAMTLMGSDVEGVGESAEMAHETWAYVTELVVGIFILASQVKWFWPVPLAIMFCKLLKHLVFSHVLTVQCVLASVDMSRRIFGPARKHGAKQLSIACRCSLQL